MEAHEAGVRMRTGFNASRLQKTHHMPHQTLLTTASSRGPDSDVKAFAGCMLQASRLAAAEEVAGRLETLLSMKMMALVDPGAAGLVLPSFKPPSQPQTAGSQSTDAPSRPDTAGTEMLRFPSQRLGTPALDMLKIPSRPGTAGSDAVKILSRPGTSGADTLKVPSRPGTGDSSRATAWGVPGQPGGGTNVGMRLGSPPSALGGAGLAGSLRGGQQGHSTAGLDAQEADWELVA